LIDVTVVGQNVEATAGTVARIDLANKRQNFRNARAVSRFIWDHGTMSKPDKLPYIDPMQPNVYGAIIRTVVEVRKQRQSHEYRREQERIALAERARHDAAELERRKAEAERISAQRYAAAMAGGLILREAETPKFVR
jgi:hypothetical protein